MELRGKEAGVGGEAGFASEPGFLAWQQGAARPWGKSVPGWVGLRRAEDTRRRGGRPGLGRGVEQHRRRAGWGLSVRVGQGQESSTWSLLLQKARSPGAESGHGDLVPAGLGYSG